MRSALPLTVLRVPAQEGNKTLTLALVWQLMRAYTLNMLQTIGSAKQVEAEIVKVTIYLRVYKKKCPVFNF